MRHKYDTRGIVLARTPLGETNALVTVLTPDLGLVRARAQGVRRPGAKLAAALVTFAQSELVLVRGKDAWRVAGAVLEENWFVRLETSDARARAARVAHLLLRLAAGDVQDPELFSVLRGFLESLATVPEEHHDAAEVLAALHILHVLGFDAGDLPGGASPFTEDALVLARRERAAYIARINHGIAASGL